MIGKNDFPNHFKKIIVRYKNIDYDIYVLGQTVFFFYIKILFIT